MSAKCGIALALVAAWTGGCVDLTPDGKVFACPGCTDAGHDAGAPDAGSPCVCPLPSARCSGSTKVTPVSARCLSDAGCGFETLQTLCPQGCSGGSCIGDPCLGVVCSAPPPNACVDANTQISFGSSGSCSNGGCSYVGVEISCACSGGVCTNSPCTNVTCLSPPPASCVDASTLRTYGATGVCQGAGQCVYGSTDTPCGTGGCVEGQCLSNPCAGVTCNRPPSAACLSSTELRTYANPGTCAAGSCTYVPTTVLCPTGQQCSQGACVVPPPQCNATNCLGCCQGLTCLDVSTETSLACGSGGATCATCGPPTSQCRTGACVNPCSGVTCTKAPTCFNSTTVESYVGSCDSTSGACSYSPSEQACPTGQSCTNGVCLCVGSACGGWALRSTTGPSPRYGLGLAYDPVRQRTALFGGSDGTGAQGDTWEWDGTAWSLAGLYDGGVSVPVGRVVMGMTYNAAESRTMMVFGCSDFTCFTVYQGTWEWDGTSWNAFSDGGTPPARGDMGLTYDAQHQQLLMFGGTSLLTFTGSALYGWDHTSTWHTVFLDPDAGPSARQGMGFGYDTARNQAVMFGGITGAAGSDVADTWTWNGTGWAGPLAQGPSARSGVGMVYDQSRGATVLFGGGPFAAPESPETWEWNGSAWGLRASTGPHARRNMGFAYDSARGKVVMFGGISSLGDGGTVLYGDTWEY